MKLAVKIGAGLLLLAAVALFAVWYRTNQGLAEVKTIKVVEPDVTHLADGIYDGSYSIPPVSVAVKVHMVKGKYERIDITKHENGLGKEAEALAERIVEAQSVDVDDVSGATVSSRCIKKAVEDAVTEGR